jgi:hypothetical protein
MKKFDNEEYEDFKKWIDSLTTDITKENEAERICKLMIDEVLLGKKFIDGKFKEDEEV